MCVESMNKFWIGKCRSNVLVKVNRRYVSIQEWTDSIEKERFHEVEIDGRKFLVYNKHLYIRSLNCVEGDSIN